LSKIRVFELAKEYGLKGPELAELLRNLGFDQIKTHMAALDDASLMQIEARLLAHGLNRKAVAETQAVEAASSDAHAGGLLRKKALPPAVPGRDKVEPTRKKLPGQGGAAPEPTAPAPRVLPQKGLPAKALPAAHETGGDDGTAFEPEPTPRSVADRPAAERALADRPAAERPVADRPAAARTPDTRAPAASSAAPAAKPQPAAEPERPSAKPATPAASTQSTTPRDAAPKATEPIDVEAPAATRSDTPPSTPTSPATSTPAAAAAATPTPSDAEGTTPPATGTPDAAAPAGPHIKRLLVPQAKAQVLRRIELPQETIRDATRRSAPAADRGPGGAANRDLRARALQNTQTRTATNRSGPVGQRRGPMQSGGPFRSGSRVNSRRGPGPRMQAAVDPNKIIELTPPVSIKGLSEALGIKVSDLIKTLTFTLGIKGKTINSFLNQEEVEFVAVEVNRNIKIVERREAEEELLQTLVDETATEETYHRAPVVTFMGHVDHGKTTLLDALRKSDVASGEAGGITQHVGAYKITTESGHSIVVLDTPGHAAFTAMRARGASITDIVVLVVAADDGVMPQTEEAISHALAANVPIVVALTKCDRGQANPTQVKQQLMIKGLQAEEWGGKTQMAEVSATKGTGLVELVEKIMLEAELLDLKAAPSAPATGVVIESKQTPEQGITVNVLVTNGTLRVKDHILCGDSLSRVRSMTDDHGRTVLEAGPSTPVRLFGISVLPQPGDKLYAITDVKKAKEVAGERQRRTRDLSLAERSSATVTLENLSEALAAQKVSEFKIILKADVMGSLEPIKRSLEELSTPEVKFNILHTALGGITEADVALAEASKAVVIGFNTNPDASARQAAERAGVEIRFYDVIYSLIDDMRLALEGMLAPERVENVIGHAEVRAVFKSSRAGNIAGCFVLDGVVQRNAKARLMRGGKLIYTGTVASLKRIKDDAREVRAGYECGMTLSDFDEIREGDVIECFEITLVKRTLK
jgi:translation initiation factor IF-2